MDHGPEKLPARHGALLFELGTLVAACLLLIWLNRGDRQPEPLYGAFLGPSWSFLAVVLATWVAPGYVLCRFAPGPWRRSLPQLVAFSFGLGAAWVAVPAAVVLYVGGWPATGAWRGRSSHPRASASGCPHGAAGCAPTRPWTTCGSAWRMRVG